jgi:acetyl-CoA carboxylase / biotin carboxylase 1
MEAKGCAKPAVWKDARRYFYWALRARIARSDLLELIEGVNPELEPEERATLLDSLIPATDLSDNRALAEVLEQLNITPTLVKLKTDHLLNHFTEVAEDDRKASLDGLVRIIDSLSDDEKMFVQSAIQNSVRFAGKLITLSCWIDSDIMRFRTSFVL